MPSKNLNYFADNPTDLGGTYFESEDLKKVKEWAQEVADRTGEEVLVWCSWPSNDYERAGEEIQTVVSPRKGNPFPDDYGEDPDIVSEHTAYGLDLEIFEYQDEFGFVVYDDEGNRIVEGTGYPDYKKAYSAGRSEAKKEWGG